MPNSESLTYEQARIGDGVYTAADIAFILNVKPHKAHYWFTRYAKDQLEKATNYRYYFGEQRDFVNFRTLVQLYVFIHLRESGIRTSTILEAYQTLSDFFGDPYPFARQELYTLGSEILFLHLDKPVVASRAQQYVFEDMLHTHCQKLDFIDQIAVRYYPRGQDSPIVVDPKIQFGMPTIKGTRLDVATVYEMYQGGESIELISSQYSISKEAAKASIKFFEDAA